MVGGEEEGACILSSHVEQSLRDHALNSYRLHCLPASGAGWSPLSPVAQIRTEAAPPSTPGVTVVGVQSTQAKLHIRSTKRNGASIVSYSLQMLCPADADEGEKKSESYGEGEDDGDSEWKEQSTKAWCDLMMVKEPEKEESGAEEEDSVEDKMRRRFGLWDSGTQTRDKQSLGNRQTNSRW